MGRGYDQNVPIVYCTKPCSICDNDYFNVGPYVTSTMMYDIMCALNIVRQYHSRAYTFNRFSVTFS